MYFPGEDEDLDESDSSDEEFSDEDDFEDDEDAAMKDSKYNEVIQGGDVYSCGYGYFGQLGHNSSVSLSIPQKISELKNIVQVSCGESHSIAVAGNGYAFSWGCNRYGQLGLGDTRDRSTPQVIPMEGIKIAESACGTFHSALLTRTGEVYTFGCGSAGRLGHGDSKYLQSPKVVTTLRGKRITQIACGAWFTICVSNAGAAYSWGFNRFGQLGIGKNPPAQNFPRHITALYGKPIVKVACGKQHTALITDEGECYTFGLGVCGQLGHKNKTNQSQPKLIESFTKRVVDIACGSLHTLALTHDGKMYIWGYVSNDHLGLSEGDEYHSTPLHVVTSHLENRVVKVTAGAWHSGVLTNKGEMFTWGLSHRGRLGLGYPEDFDNEVLVNPTVPTIVEAFDKKFVLNNALGGAHTLAIVLELEPEKPKNETPV